MDDANLSLAAGLVSRSYISQGGAALATRRRQVRALLSNRRMPDAGWDEASLEMLLQDLALMDSNTFPGQVGLGEREGRVVCPLVARLHGRLAHGVGRSGDVAAEQPKAAGSSLLAKLAAALAGDALRIAGLTGFGTPLVLPCATGMSLTLALLAAAAAPADAHTPGDATTATALVAQQTQSEPQPDDNGNNGAQQAQHTQPAVLPQPPEPQPQLQPRYVVWSRIDQKTCLKAITAANLIPIVVELQRVGDELRTDLPEIEARLMNLGPGSVAAVVTTTSCFAPRAADDVVSVARLCARLGVPHIVNNAYGLQASALCAALSTAARRGRIDAVIQSTDKNFCVPVGGALLAAPASRPWLLHATATRYPGRASLIAHRDLLVTLLHWGASGWRSALEAREELHCYLTSALGDAAAQLGERLLSTPGNPISLGLTLDGLAAAAASANAAAAAGPGAGAAACSAADVAGGGFSKRAAVQHAHRTRADVTFFGAMLWARNVSGTRVVASGKAAVVGGVSFSDYGSHTSYYPHQYLTAAAALGGTHAEVDVFITRLVKAYLELRRKWGALPEVPQATLTAPCAALPCDKDSSGRQQPHDNPTDADDGSLIAAPAVMGSG